MLTLPNQFMERPFDVHLACLNATLATLSSPHLKEFHDSHSARHKESLDSLLISLSRLKDIDALLSRPQFSRLHRVKLDYTLNIYIEEIPSTSDASHPIPPDGSIPDPDSCSQSGSLDNIDLNNEEDRFRIYAEGRIRTRILEELKQFRDHSELEIELQVWPRYKWEDED